MKLSEAIRKGCTMSPIQGFGVPAMWEGNRCALGAALLALGHSGLGNEAYLFLEEKYPFLIKPASHKYRAVKVLTHLIFAMNDVDRISREEIANFIETNFESGAELVTREVEEPVLAEHV